MKTTKQAPGSKRILNNSIKKNNMASLITQPFSGFYWATTGILLAGIASGCSYCVPVVIGLTIIQTFWFAIRGQSSAPLSASI